MKTALQELIEWMEEQYYPAMYEDAIDKATELLEKEKEQIEEAYDKGFGKFKSAEQYFNETFNQQPEVDYQKMFANCSLPNEKQEE